MTFRGKRRYLPQSRMISAGPYLDPLWTRSGRVRAFTTTRLGGVSQAPFNDLNLGLNAGDNPEHVLENRRILKRSLPSEPLWLKQVHGVTVSTPASRLLHLSAPYEADAAITNIPNEVLAILAADCMPVLFASARGDVIGAAHAGWRGLSGGILENTVQEMCALNPGLTPQDISVWMGPAIGPKAFEVGEDVLHAFASQGSKVISEAFKSISGSAGKYLANLYLLAEDRLHAMGVGNIQSAGFCTYTDQAKFFSYRRDGVTGRFASLIWFCPDL